MSIARIFSVGFLSVALFSFTGCVGPMAHGPLGGCCGPELASHENACTGCGELYVDPWINEPANCVDPCDTCGNYNGQSCGKCRPMFEGIRSLWGYRCGDDCGDCGDPGCAVSCGCGALEGDLGCGSQICGPSAGCGCGDSCGCSSGGSGCGCSSSGGTHSGEIIHDHGGGHIIGQHDGQIINGGEYIVEGGQPITNGVPTPAPSAQGIRTAKPVVQQPFKPERARKIFNPRPRVATGDGRSVGY